VEGTNGDNSGYRILLATFADLEAAAEDDDERSNAIEAACQSGGDFVGNYYYQYEVSIESYFCAGQQPYSQFYLTSLGSSEFSRFRRNSTNRSRNARAPNIHGVQYFSTKHFATRVVSTVKHRNWPPPSAGNTGDEKGW
jgi:hypothetical protein